MHEQTDFVELWTRHLTYYEEALGKITAESRAVKSCERLAGATAARGGSDDSLELMCDAALAQWTKVRRCERRFPRFAVGGFWLHRRSAR